MNDVFISYKREDEVRVGRLVRALQKHKLSVWWDRALPGGEPWRANIEAALTHARCVVVVWTKASTGADGGFVKDESARAARRRILVPVLFDKVDQPVGFGELQAIDLTQWRGSERDPFLRALVAAVRAKMDGRAAAPPLRQKRRLLRWLVWAAALVMALATGFANNTLNSQNTICALDFAQPALSDACAAVGLGDRPLKAERVAWEQRSSGDCDVLRQHIREFPQGVFRETATALLSARKVTAVEAWVAVQRPLRMVVARTNALPAATENAAKSSAIERGRLKANAICHDFEATGLSRLLHAEAQAQEWFCESTREGFACGFEGRAICKLEELSKIQHETCNADLPR